jgi:methionine-rich copper-binding protein CopC
MKTISTLSALAAAASLVLLASQAQAHAHLVKSSPAANAAVSAPQTLQLQFSEKLEPKFSGLELTTAKGDEVGVASTVSAKDRKTISATPKAALKPGAYTVMWHVVSADGHKMKGDYAFTVK